MGMPNLDTLMEPLQDSDLASARLDLPSWLLEDEAQLGFCHGAKEMHSFASGVAGHASPPFITANCSELDIYDQIDWNKPLCLEECFPDDLKEQVKSLTQSNDADPVISVNQQLPDSHLNTQDVTSPEVLLHWTGHIPAFVTPKEVVAPEAEWVCSSPTPQIIPVPISEVVSSDESSSVLLITSVPSATFSSDHQPQKLVINLKRVPVAPKPSVPLEECHGEETVPESHTFKDVMCSDDADDQLMDLMTSPDAPEQETCTQDSSEEPNCRDFISLVSPDQESLDAEMTYEELTEDSNIFLLSPKSFVSSPSRQDVLRGVKSSGRKARASPYSAQEKRLRKKEQNKRAALRYRQKKKEEEDSVLGILNKEEARQKDLAEKYNALLIEVRILKKLLGEVFAKKRLTKRNSKFEMSTSQN